MELAVLERHPAVIPTAGDPIKAFKQGLSDEPTDKPTDRRYRIVGVRCPDCEFLEFYGDGERAVGS